MNKYLIIGVVTILIIGAGWWHFNKANVDTEQTPFSENGSSINPAEEEETSNTNRNSNSQINTQVIPANYGSLTGTLSYTHTEYADPQMKRFGVLFQYSTQPLCDSQRATDTFSIDSGDERTYAADCHGVVEHMYSTPGTYTARYLMNGAEIARVVVVIQ